MNSPVPSIQPGDGDARRRPPRERKASPLAKAGLGDTAAPPVTSEAAILAHAGVPPFVLDGLKRLALRWGVPLREAALATGAVRAPAYLRTLAGVCGIGTRQAHDELRLRALSPAPEPYRLLMSRQPVPLASPRGAAALNAESLTPEAVAQLADDFGPGKQRLSLVGRRELSEAIARAYGPQLALNASGALDRSHPRFSASWGASRWQIVFLSLAAGIFLGAILFAPREALVVYSAGLSLMFMLTISLRIGAAVHACYRRLRGRKMPLRRMPDADLPRYSVLVAMYREARVLPQLVAALEALDYPCAKLDIKLVLEADDAETITAARALKLAPHFEIAIVPEGTPRTKPRALNYALQFASGDYLVIYDAEDRPDPA